jgi:cholesterol transport system auxiliary component
MSRTSLIMTLAVSLGLGGCVSLFPKADPAQLYRFDAPEAQAVTVSPTLSVLRGPTGFTRAAASDRILTVNGAESAFIKGGRWEAPAAILFDEALAEAFDASTQVRLTTRGEPAPTDGVLRTDVRTFEARYLQGMEASPTAVVEVRVTVSSGRDPNIVTSRMFRAEQQASENRLGPIVQAYDAAVDKVLGEIVTWTGETVSRLPRPSAAASPR